MATQLDGARNALCGFLFQAVVDLGMTAQAIFLEGEDDTDPELNALVSIVRDGTLQEEVFGQDAMLRDIGIANNHKIVLVQYKYSRKLAPPSIEPAELVEIAEKLSKSAAEAIQHGQPVTAYALISNRQLGPDALRMMAAAESDGQHAKIVSLAVRDVLKNLLIPESARIETLLNDLQGDGFQYGSTTDEIRESLQNLFGKLTFRIAAGASPLITRSTLLQAFTGYGEASPLLPNRVASQSRANISRVRSSSEQPTTPIRRDALDEIGKLVVEHALIVLRGVGGGGKTVALIEWLFECAETNPPNERAFVQFTHSRNAQSDWVEATVSEWIGPPVRDFRRNDDINKTLERLTLANPTLGHPILRLGLDGLDESSLAHQSGLSLSILQWFLNEEQRCQTTGNTPRATLVVTCRTSETINENLIVDPTGYVAADRSLPKVELSDFSTSELHRAAQACSEPVQTLLDQAARSLEPNTDKGSQSYTQLMGAGNSISVGPAANSDVVRSLRHPALWRAFAALPETIQIAVLRNDSQAIGEICRIFVTAQAFSRGMSGSPAKTLVKPSRTE